MGGASSSAGKRRRNCYFKKAKRSKSSLLWCQYKHAQNRVTSQLRQAKKEYFCNLNTSSTKQFWKTIKVLNKQGASIGSLTHGDTTCMSDEDKADAFNAFFSSCFNSTYPPISTTTSTCDHGCSDSIMCTEEEVCELLKSLDITKVNGPDRISARNQQPMQLLHHLQNYSTAPLHVAVLQPAGYFFCGSHT